MLLLIGVLSLTSYCMSGNTGYRKVNYVIPQSEPVHTATVEDFHIPESAAYTSKLDYVPSSSKLDHTSNGYAPQFQEPIQKTIQAPIYEDEYKQQIPTYQSNKDSYASRQPSHYMTDLAPHPVTDFKAHPVTDLNAHPVTDFKAHSAVFHPAQQNNYASQKSTYQSSPYNNNYQQSSSMHQPSYHDNRQLKYDDGYDKHSQNYGQNSGFKQINGYDQTFPVNQGSRYRQDSRYGQDSGYGPNFRSSRDSRNNQNSGYGQDFVSPKDISYNQDSGYAQDTGYDQDSGYAQDTGYGQDSGYGQNSGYSQDSNHGQYINARTIGEGAYIPGAGFIAGYPFVYMSDSYNGHLPPGTTDDYTADNSYDSNSNPYSSDKSHNSYSSNPYSSDNSYAPNAYSSDNSDSSDSLYSLDNSYSTDKSNAASNPYTTFNPYASSNLDASSAPYTSKGYAVTRYGNQNMSPMHKQPSLSGTGYNNVPTYSNQIQSSMYRNSY